MLRNETTAIEINSKTVRFSGRSIIVINLTQIVEVIKGRRRPPNVGWYLMCALLSALAVSGLGIVVSDRVDAVADFDLRETFETVARYVGGGHVLLLVVRALVWVFRRETYGLMIGTTAGGWYTISAKSDEAITEILEAILTRMESQQQMPSVKFHVDQLEVSTRPANNVISSFVAAGRDAAVVSSATGGE